LHVTLTGKTAGIPYPHQQQAITSFTGTLTLDIPPRYGCAGSSTYQVQFRNA
jgi:hypothetical protein